MSKLRINNATLFVTVLSACLGLVAAGASSQVNQTASSVLSEITSATSANLSYSRSSNQGLKLAAAYTSRLLPFAAQSAQKAPKVLYKNRPALTASHQILVVTRRSPRASLDNLPA
jgi:ABC-type phosphate transport system substrate-binding protein